ncbi:hypothetical protein SVIO_007530 [Streptomyces violaceusniger]|uniref:Uncharacterized protein n=1 Tax=Streptomyces violaceusniger TaxID=68280 RepID=A0A4D4KU81_STRVO|nr:hypothetical protein SVIO_007530 [Streptomyces violaceusniger]
MVVARVISNITARDLVPKGHVASAGQRDERISLPPVKHAGTFRETECAHTVGSAASTVK